MEVFLSALPVWRDDCDVAGVSQQTDLKCRVIFVHEWVSFHVWSAISNYAVHDQVEEEWGQ